MDDLHFILAVRAVIPFVFGFFAPFAYDQYTQPKIFLAALLVLFASFRPGSYRVKTLTWPLLFMFGALTISALNSGDCLVNLDGRYCSRYLGLIPLAVCLLAYHLRPIKNLTRQMRISAAILSVYGLLQLVWNPLGYPVLSAGHRIIGTMGSPPSLGCALAMCLPFCIGCSWRKLCLFSLVVAALIATGSRGPLIAGLVAAIYVSDWGTEFELIALWAVGTASVVLFFSHGSSDKIRTMTWIMSIKVWLAHPVFGCGGESFADAWRHFRSPEWVKLVGYTTMQDSAHNDLLEALAVSGIVGFIAYCDLQYRVWRQLLIANKTIVASVLAVFICAKVNAVPFPVLFALAVMLGALDFGAPIPILADEMSAVLAIMFTIYSGLIFWTDVDFYKARRALDFPGITAAMDFNTHELFYQAHAADLLTRKFNYDRDPRNLLWALKISEEAVAAHPTSVQARHMLTQNRILLGQFDPDYLEPARISAEKLLAMDPMLDFRFHVIPRR